MTEAADNPNPLGEHDKLKKNLSHKSDIGIKKIFGKLYARFGDKKEWTKNLSGKLDEIRKEITEVSIKGRQNWAHEIKK